MYSRAAECFLLHMPQLFLQLQRCQQPTQQCAHRPQLAGPMAASENGKKILLHMLQVFMKPESCQHPRNNRPIGPNLKAHECIQARPKVSLVHTGTNLGTPELSTQTQQRAHRLSRPMNASTSSKTFLLHMPHRPSILATSSFGWWRATS